jgi:ribosome-associated toxin RatA of RatAB toxin-antitoxin module
MTATTSDITSFTSQPVSQGGLPLVATEAAAAIGGGSGVTIHTEKLPAQQRRILAFVDVPFAAEQVWQVLTDYDNLSSFIPNLSYSQRLSHPQGGIRLEQIGSQCFLNVKFCARVVLDMVETFPKELKFSMVEGDFRQFEGQWTLEPIVKSQSQLTRLNYDLLVQPPRAMPAALIERHIRHDLTRNLRAIGDRTAQVFLA